MNLHVCIDSWGVTGVVVLIIFACILIIDNILWVVFAYHQNSGLVFCVTSWRTLEYRQSAWWRPGGFLIWCKCFLVCSLLLVYSSHFSYDRRPNDRPMRWISRLQIRNPHIIEWKKIKNHGASRIHRVTQVKVKPGQKRLHGWNTTRVSWLPLCTIYICKPSKTWLRTS